MLRNNKFQVVRFVSDATMNHCYLFDSLEETTSESAGQDNRNLCDEGTANQNLQHDDIEQLKLEGVSGQAIISQLVSNSVTFEKKTVFSQQKYLNKKKKKLFSFLSDVEKNNDQTLCLFCFV